ncbi:MAG: hypothetical protein ACI9EF_001174 [Pseudohongiellaceae bacterium]|jgi:hypothetical protein
MTAKFSQRVRVSYDALIHKRDGQCSEAVADRARVQGSERADPAGLAGRVLRHGLAALLSEGYAHAAELVSALSLVACRSGLPLRLLAYDRRVERDVTVRNQGGHQRLLIELAELPRRTLVNNALGRAQAGELERRAQEVEQRLLWRWRGFDDQGAALAEASGDEACAEPLADLSIPDLVELAGHCPQCGSATFDDESACPSCTVNLGGGELSPRAACLAGLLVAALSKSHGRETLVLISSAQGGEAEEQLCRLLELLVQRCGTVHVVVPELSALSGWRPRYTGSIAETDGDTPILADMERLAAVQRGELFAHRLARAGVSVHRLQDRDSIDEVVARLLLDEVLVP